MSGVRLLRPLLAASAACAALLAPGPAAAAATPVTWCGNDVVQGDRLPDFVAGSQIHVVYARPADAPDRFRELASGIATDLGAIDAWWRGQDATRAPRFDTFGFPGCETPFGRLDITSLKLSRRTSAYDKEDASDASNEIYTDLVRTPLGRPSTHKKFLVYWDGRLTENEACAVSFESAHIAFYWLRPPPDGCPPVDVGQGEYAALVAAHELVHNLGAVPRGAPNACEGNEGHICDDERDIVHGTPSLIPFGERILDAGRNDYYGHGKSWPDVRNSPFLLRLDAPQQRLTISLGEGGGSVTSDVPGVSCPPACDVLWDGGTKIVLQARASAGKRFVTWGGACRSGYPRCTLTMSAARAVTATFGTSSSSGGTGGTGGTTRNRAPSARMGRLAKFRYEVREKIEFVSESRDYDGTIAKVEWNFGDGTKATGERVTHAYKKEGYFTVSLTVVDDAGASQTTKRTVRVQRMPPRAMALFVFGKLGQKLQLRFYASDDTAVTRLRIFVVKGKRVLTRRTIRVKPNTRSLSGSAAWRAPKRRVDGLEWCVKAWDGFGNTSERACSRILLR